MAVLTVMAILTLSNTMNLSLAAETTASDRL